MKASTWLLGTCTSLVLLSGCGGSKETTTVLATVSSVENSQIAYRKTYTMTVNGQNLDKGITVVNPLCLSLTEVAGGSATKRTFTCKIVGVGTGVATVTNANGGSLYQASLTSSLSAQPQVTMGTSKGNIVIELNPAKAPVTVDNFLNYVESGFYPNKIFHRVEANLVVQGGGYTSDLQLATTSAAIKLESSNGLSNTRGTIGMARTSVADSATSQFYFNTVDNTAFDYSSTNAGYAVFGKVVAGLDVVDLIRVVPVSTQGGLSNVPVTPVFITSATQTQ
ncbi:peptidylprolyl isomerase [Undibacterium sp. CY21W]|uniref:peptidylprolyl isomerase n=1 Tax=Undibacterium sp. CY21W TaxID=2762293 RepID=UPI00351BE95F